MIFFEYLLASFPLTKRSVLCRPRICIAGQLGRMLIQRLLNGVVWMQCCCVRRNRDANGPPWIHLIHHSISPPQIRILRPHIVESIESYFVDVKYTLSIPFVHSSRGHSEAFVWTSTAGTSKLHQTFIQQWLILNKFLFQTPNPNG